MAEPDDAPSVALAEQLGAQIGRLKGAGPKLMQFLSMLRLDGSSSPAGARPAGVQALPFSRVKRVIEHDLGAPVVQAFDDFDEQPFALASLGQVHRARTLDG